jgi:hypothetical protein
VYLLYLDESGTHAEASHFVLAGLAVFERETYWYAQDLDALQRRYLPDISDPVEFHVSPMRGGKGAVVPEPWDRLTFEQRRELVTNIYQIIRDRRGVLFGVAIEKAWLKGEDPYARGFEDLISRFDLYVRRINAQSPSEPEQRGVVVVAESTYRDNLEVLGQRFRGGGTRWGQVRTMAEVPFFLPARNTRLLQLADFCANALHGRYSSGLTRDFDVIAPRFDREGDRIHGLSHLTRDYQCQCLGCINKH